MPLSIYDLVIPALLLGLLVPAAYKSLRNRRGLMIALAPAAIVLVYGYAVQLQTDRVAREAGFLDASDKAMAENEGYADPVAWSGVRAAVVADQGRRDRQACIDDFNCWTNRYVDEASRACSPAIERMAQYSFEWQASGTLERFPRAIIGPGGTVITYEGDAITFQKRFWGRRHRQLRVHL